MALNHSKLIRQYECVRKWNSNNQVGLFDIIMGFGKTLTGLMCADSVNEDNMILVIVHNATGRDRWLDEINANSHNLKIPKYDYSHRLRGYEHHYKILTIGQAINDIVNLTAGRWGTLIVDEIHKYLTPDRYEVISKLCNVADRRLALTGTLPNVHTEDYKKIIRLFPLIDEISESEALKHGWISNFIEFNIALDFTDKYKSAYYNLSSPIKGLMSQFEGVYKKFKTKQGFVFNSDFDLIGACYHGKTIDGLYINGDNIRQAVAMIMGWNTELDLTDDYGKIRDEYWNPNVLYDKSKQFLELVRLRNEILINNDIKLNAIIKLFEMFPNTTICFNESTDFATRVSAAINLTFASIGSPISIVYHTKAKGVLIDPNTGDYYRHSKKSKTPNAIKILGKDSIKRIAIDGVRDGTYKFLSTARALDEGLDISNIEQVITSGGTTNPIQYEQRKGRGTRVDAYNPNKITKIFNLYFDDFVLPTGNGVETVKSRDKSKLVLRQTDSGNTVVWLKNLSDIENIL